MLTEHIDGWETQQDQATLLSRLLSTLDRVAMAVAELAVRTLVRAINWWFRMVER